MEVVGIAVGLIATVVSLFAGRWLGRRDLGPIQEELERTREELKRFQEANERSQETNERNQAMLNAITRALDDQGTRVTFKRDDKGLATGALLYKVNLTGDMPAPHGDLQATVIRRAEEAE